MILTLDFESAFGLSPSGRKVTIKAQTTEEYVRDPEFVTHGVGLKVNDGEPKYYFGHQIQQIFDLIPWDQVYLLCHHAQFDGAVLAWKYGIFPKFYLDTISMAQALYNHQPASLENLSKFLGLGTKGKELESVRNKWFLTEGEQKVLGGYCVNDVDLTYKLFQAMKKGYPPAELETIDDTIWMFTNPVFDIDVDLLRPAYEAEVKRKADLVTMTGLEKINFTSNPRFADLLRSRNVPVPMKLSVTTGQPTYAFAKTDEEFLALEHHADPVVGQYVKTRFGVKTSIVETRIKRFIEIGGRGRLPAYVKANSAHTARPAGGDKSNLLNMSNRGDGLVLRNSMIAPPGHSIVVADLASIEARILVQWAGQEDRVDVFRRGEDPYNNMASDLYGRPVDRKNVEADKKAGAVGKATVLGCGYGLGWLNFQGQLRVGFLGMEGVTYGQDYVDQLGANIEHFKLSRSYDPKYQTLEEQALSVLPLGMDVEEYLTHCAVVWTIVNKYREMNPKVKQLWKTMNKAIEYMIAGQEVQIGPVKTVKDGLLLPSGKIVRYTGLKKTKSGDYKYLKQIRNSGYEEWVKLYGGKVVENGTQGMAWILLARSITDTRKAGFNVALPVYDEQVSVVPTEQARACQAFVYERLCTPPAWMPDLPLDAEVEIVQRYGEAK